MPYYCANARAIFERGNGLAHPNPYDPDPQAPVIYFHWLTWLLGVSIKKLGLEPGAVFVGVGVLGSFLCSYLTFRLVERILPEGRYRILLFLFTMWGGGLLCLGRVAQNLVHGRPAAESLFAYDPFDGWWFLYWGRNLIFPTEAVYHALVAAVWLAVLARRWGLVVAGAALLAATHPFSGLQTLLILFTWLSILVWLQRSWPLLRTWSAVAALLCLFFGYYLVFLESFEQHRALRQTWSLPWTLSRASLLLAHGPIGLIAARRVYRDRRSLDWGAFFFVVCFAVSLLLAKHEWLLAPRQPLHFTRGYIWMPLCLLALPALQRFLISARCQVPRVAFGLLLLLFSAIAVSDNAAFLARACQNQWQNEEEAGYFLTPGERDMFSWIDGQHLDGVLLSPDAKLSYLSATYTSVRPYYGHWSETPQFQQRTKEVQVWFEEGKGGPWMAGIDYILFPRKYIRTFHHLADWQMLYENDELLLLGRPAGSVALLRAAGNGGPRNTRNTRRIGRTAITIPVFSCVSCVSWSRSGVSASVVRAL